MLSSLARVLIVVGALMFSACGNTPPAPKEAPPTTSAQAPAPRHEPVPKAPVTHNGSILQAIKQRGEIRIGMQVGYVPFQMPGSGGDLVGFDVDMAELVARSLKVSLRVVRLRWEELVPSLMDGGTDVVMSGMAITPERNEQVMFTVPVVESGRMFLVHVSNADRFRRLDALNQSGIFVVSGPGGPGELDLKQILPMAAYREFPDRKRALVEVVEKRAHAFIDDEYAVRQAVAAQAEKLTSPFTPLTYEPIAWAVHPRDAHWLNWLNNFIRKMERDGQLDELKKKWLHDYFLDVPAKNR